MWYYTEQETAEWADFRSIGCVGLWDVETLNM